jgi:hypothetical protein
MDRDVLQILTEDHAVLAWLAGRLGGARPGRSRTVLFNEFARALGAHQTVIDRTVLPALKACGWAGVSSDVLRSHMALKRLLAEAITLEREPADFDATVRRLVPQAQRHCELELYHIIPVLHRCFDDEQRALLAADAEQHLTRLLGETPKLYADNGLPPDAGELVEEAHVVLGSLPVPGLGPPARH